MAQDSAVTNLKFLIILNVQRGLHTHFSWDPTNYAAGSFVRPCRTCTTQKQVSNIPHKAWSSLLKQSKRSAEKSVFQLERQKKGLMQIYLTGFSTSSAHSCPLHMEREGETKLCQRNYQKGVRKSPQTPVKPGDLYKTSKSQAKSSS